MPLAVYCLYEPTFNLSRLVETQFATNFIMVDRLVNVWEAIEKHCRPILISIYQLFMDLALKGHHIKGG